MHSRQSLELRQHQQLALTPQLQQAIKFLQLSAHELELEVAQALLDNPLLEREEEYDTVGADAVADEAQSPDDQWMSVDGAPKGSGSQSDDDAVRPEAALQETLQEHLTRQLYVTRASHRDMALVSILIEELDDKGYLPTSLDDVLASLPAELEVELEELQAALRLLQSFDPPGVGARSLSECLCLQLAQMSDQSADDLQSECKALALKIACEHLPLLATGNLTRLRAALECEPEALKAAHGLLLQLEPRPGRHWATNVADYVTPDVLIRKVRQRWVASVNPVIMPKLRVNAVYQELLAEAPPAPAMTSQLQQAQGLIKSVNQRFVTVLRVAQAVVDKQQDYFEHGVSAMRPLLLRDIAQELDMHESTVSRATKHKFAQTPWGVIELRRFFGAALQTEDGESTSATAVRSLIAKLVSEESGKKPLSDSQLAVKLAERGVVIARRTVAKYREAAGIEPAILRKARASLEQA
jgi:RNA polymerase sigma-54 factor